MNIETLMIFAAGTGSRMKDLTQTLPKPLAPILGRPIIHYVLDFALTFPFKKVIINTHHLAHFVRESVEKFWHMHRPHAELIITYEEEKQLGNGGAIKHAAEYLREDEYIFTLNSDSIINTNDSIFNRMLNIWKPETMDFLLLLENTKNVVGHISPISIKVPHIIGDEAQGEEYMYIGMQILKPKIIFEYSKNAFFTTDCLTDRVYSLVSNGKFYHVTYVHDIKAVEDDMKNSN